MRSFNLKDCFHILFRLRKLVLGKDLLYVPLNNYSLKKYGNEGAAWVIKPTIQKDSVVYSFGIGNDISFDLAMIQDFKVKIYAFDPTPKCQQWLKEQTLPTEFIFEPVGLAAHDGTVRFFLPENPNHVSASVLKKNQEGKYFDATVQRLSTIAEKYGHKKIDILKMDIEGSEYEVIDDILKSDLEIKQILIEFHHRFKGVGKQKTRDAIKKLQKKGYKVIHVIQKTGEEYAFLKCS